MPVQGEVLCHEKFQFKDGPTGKKLVVVLNNPAPRDPCIVVKTTSQSRRYQGVKPGCNPSRRVFFLPDTGKDGIKGDTYIQLDELFELSVPAMVASALKKEFYPIAKLQDLTFRQIKNCLKTVRLDISERHYKLIFK